MLYDKRWDAQVKVATEPWRALLLNAAEVLETVGHTKGRSYCYQTGAVCLVGALNMADHGTPINEYPYPPTLREVRVRLFDKVGQPLPLWNDTPERTAGEVIALLRETAYD